MTDDGLTDVNEPKPEGFSVELRMESYLVRDGETRRALYRGHYAGGFVTEQSALVAYNRADAALSAASLGIEERRGVVNRLRMILETERNANDGGYSVTLTPSFVREILAALAESPVLEKS